MNKFNLKRSMLAVFYIYLSLLAFLYFFQRNLQYHPIGQVLDPAAYQLEDFSKQILTTKDNVKILSWYKKPKNKNDKIILYFHGNAGNLGGRSQRFRSFADKGYGILAVTYRGYPGSEGKPSEIGLINDGNAALEFLSNQGFKTQDIILFGESLGSGIAIQLAQKIDFHALILESPYSSIASVARRSYWFVPVNLLLKDKFESIKYAPDIISPVLIFHGTVDPVVPYEEGQKLFAAINSKKKLVTVEREGHLGFAAEFVIDEMKKFLSD